MSFLNKSSFGDKPSLVKPVIIVVSILLVIGGAYSLFGNKKAETKEVAGEEKPENKAEILPTGLDSDMKVKTVADVEMVIAKWIEVNPKAILTAVANMQKKAAEDQAKNAQKNITTKKDELFEDKNSPTLAPSGHDVTIVEFFDYSCGYCKKAQTTVENLLKEDKKIRFIYKEYPILGQASADMSSIALAINMIDKNAYKKFHDGLMKSNARSKDEAMKIAKQIGVDMAKLEETLVSEKENIAKILQANSALGASIGINGTPGFVIGEELIPGAIDLAAFKEKIAAARKQ